MCAEDVLFYFSAICMVFEPRPRLLPNGKESPKVLPFIPWEHQIPIIQAIDENLGYSDIAINKSRGEGASWIGVLFGSHTWLFKPDSAVGFVSKDEKTGDTPGDISSLMGKVEFLLNRALPRWMAGDRDKDWKRSIQDHTIKNLRNNSIITSYAATGDVASGGRTTWFLCDELSKWIAPKDEEAMASTEPVTDSRLIVSTPKGASGAYYDIINGDDGELVRLTLAWENNPTRNRGLYTMVRGRPVAVDPVNNPLLPAYDPPTREVMDRWARLRKKGFNIDKGVRSEWFDIRCDRAKMTPRIIAQEYERDFGGSSYKIFAEEVMSAVEESCQTPVRRGAIHYNPETLAPDFETRDDGSVKLWVPINEAGFPPKGDYVCGVDVSSGQGGDYTSNSVIVILDMATRQQVLEYATNIVRPDDFADECIAISKMFHNAYLAWEHMGPGTAFGTQVLNRKYPYLFKRSVEWKKGRKKTKEYGYVMVGDRLRESFFSEIATCIRQECWQIRSEDLKAELPQYVRVDGKIVHQKARSSDDDATKGQAHGDRVIALGVAFQAAKDRPSGGGVEIEKPPQDPDYGTFGWRMAERERELRRGNSLWDGRSISEVARGERRGRHR